MSAPLKTRLGQPREIDVPDEDTWAAPERLSEDEGLSETGADWRWVRGADQDGDFE